MSGDTLSTDAYEVHGESKAEDAIRSLKRLLLRAYPAVHCRAERTRQSETYAYRDFPDIHIDTYCDMSWIELEEEIQTVLGKSACEKECRDAFNRSIRREV